MQKTDLKFQYQLGEYDPNIAVWKKNLFSVFITSRNYLWWKRWFSSVRPMKLEINVIISSRGEPAQKMRLFNKLIGWCNTRSGIYGSKTKNNVGKFSNEAT